jgi:hypothetical protein
MVSSWAVVDSTAHPNGSEHSAIPPRRPLATVSSIARALAFAAARILSVSESVRSVGRSMLRTGFSDSEGVPVASDKFGGSVSMETWHSGYGI